MSRVPKSKYPLSVADHLRDENFFIVAVKTPWYVDVSNYLAVGKLPRHLITKERKLIVERSARFS